MKRRTGPCTYEEKAALILSDVRSSMFADFQTKYPALDIKYSTWKATLKVVVWNIKKAYRSAARKWHPDVNQEDGAKEKFQEISEAYSVLSDPTMRQRYDQFGVAGVRSGSGGGPGPQDFDIGDIFEVCAQAIESQSVSPLRSDSLGNRDSVAVFLRRTAGRWRAATLGAHAGR